MSERDNDRTSWGASEALNRAIVEAMPCGIVRVNSDGGIVAANAEALRILGLSYDQLTHRYTRDFDTETVWEDGRPCPVDEYPVTRALRTGQRQETAMIGVKRPEGPISWAAFTAVPLLGSEGQVTGAVVTFLDVTPQRAMGAALRRSEAQIRSIVESVPGYVLLLDRDFRIQFCNRLLPGVEPAQVYGQGVVSLVCDADRPALKEKLERALATGVSQMAELRADRGLGGGTYRISVGAVKDGPQVTHLTLIAEDTTAQRELETRVLLAERLASIGTLAAGVAHEINNPLTYLMGNLELAERALAAADPQLKSLVAVAAEGAERIRVVVRDLMSFSHRDDRSRGKVDVRPVIERTARIVQHEIERRARFVCDLGDPLPELMGNDSRIGQVLLNLLINAAHAIPLGRPEHNEVRISARRLSHGFVRIGVSDTGKGIEQEMLGRIFDPFVTTKPMGEGHGAWPLRLPHHRHGAGRSYLGRESSRSRQHVPRRSAGVRKTNQRGPCERAATRAPPARRAPHLGGR